jgi:hypothetical protein
MRWAIARRHWERWNGLKLHGGRPGSRTSPSGLRWPFGAGAAFIRFGMAISGLPEINISGKCRVQAIRPNNSRNIWVN